MITNGLHNEMKNGPVTGVIPLMANIKDNFVRWHR